MFNAIILKTMLNYFCGQANDELRSHEQIAAALDASVKALQVPHFHSFSNMIC
jgi:hypothetical protein